MDQLTNVQMLGVLSAMDNAIKDERKRIYDDVKAECLEQFRETGAKQVRIDIAGVPIGTVSVSETKGEWIITDRKAFMEWAKRYGVAWDVLHVKDGAARFCYDELVGAGFGDLVSLGDEVNPNWQNGMVQNYGLEPRWADTGDVVPGVEWIPGGASGIRVTGCKIDKVLTASALSGTNLTRLALTGEVDGE